MSPGLEAHVGNRSRRLFEMTMAVAVLALGVQLTLFPQEVFKQGGALSILEVLARPQLWTIAMTILGSVRLIVVIINGVWPLSPLARQGMSIVSLCMWAMLAIGYWSMLPATKGFPSLVLTLIGFVVEANCLYALSVLRVSRQRGR